MVLTASPVVQLCDRCQKSKRRSHLKPPLVIDTQSLHLSTNSMTIAKVLLRGLWLSARNFILA
ncbi:hypothetical protein [Hydrococcus rivularis]|uniref:hypothetical protein n=1 Tax=Hydrococcus rivularis TaxID=1616834 RepID=UPI00111474EE|nr:hypothetical protein [Hydrococcus rivularis]